MTGLITSAQQKKFFSGNLFKYIFGREPNTKYDRSIYQDGHGILAESVLGKTTKV
jgi:hypothetical protein